MFVLVSIKTRHTINPNGKHETIEHTFTSCGQSEQKATDKAKKELSRYQNNKYVLDTKIISINTITR